MVPQMVPQIYLGKSPKINKRDESLKDPINLKNPKKLTYEKYIFDFFYYIFYFDLRL